MVCCVALGMVVALLARCWRWLTWQPPRQADMFAPVARRRAGESQSGSVQLSDLRLSHVVAANSRQRLSMHRWGVAIFWSGVILTLAAATDAWYWQVMAAHVPAAVGCGFDVPDGTWVDAAQHLIFHGFGVLVAWLGWRLIRHAAESPAAASQAPDMTFIGQQ